MARALLAALDMRRSVFRLASSLLATLVIGCAATAEPEPGDEGDGSEPTGSRDDEVISGNVADAVSASCETSSVKGLSLQIIAEGQCLQPNAYVEVPSRPNVTFGPNVFGYLEKPARDKLVEALDAFPNRAMTVNSMLRTIAQQYLLYRWYQNGTCGIGLAAKPGSSNHETGLAFDIDQASAWRASLEARGFSWFGSSDPVHFDYEGAGAKSYKGLDVKAFQRLWNLNNPNDKISEDGVWGPQTEQRLRKSPAKGFAIGPDCGPAGNSGSPAPACAHDVCASGDKLTASCDPCAQAVCAADSYCCSNAWDAQCVSEVAAACNKQCPSSGGGATSWSCNGSYGTEKMADGQYYATAFGCWLDAQNNVHKDGDDNCIPSCLSQAQSSGLCAGMSGPVCEESVGFYAADAARFGCMTRLKVTNAKNGKSAVVVALDYGPSCTIEKSVSHAVIDLSYPANNYLFGSAQGASDKALVHVDVVDASTPLGPVQ